MLACGTNWFLGFGCCIRLHTWFAARIGFFLAVFLCFGKAEKCVQMRAKNWFPVQRNWFPVPMHSILVNFFLLMLASAVFSVVWRQKMVSVNQFCPPNCAA